MISESPNPFPLRPSEQAIADIEDGQRLRGWIANSYAQIEFMLGDLILRCRQFSAYDLHTQTLPHDATKRVGKVKTILSKPGPLDEFAESLNRLLSRFEAEHETRNLLAHGFCEYHFTPDGDAGLHFQKWHRQPGRQDARLVRTFRLADLQAEKERGIALASEAMRLFHRIHDHFGWIERPSQ